MNFTVIWILITYLHFMNILHIYLHMYRLLVSGKYAIYKCYKSKYRASVWPPLMNDVKFSGRHLQWYLVINAKLGHFRQLKPNLPFIFAFNAAGKCELIKGKFTDTGAYIPSPV